MTQHANFSMMAPGATSRKRDDIQILEAGPNPGILYSIVDLGTQYNPNFGKSSRQVRLTFEFPFLMQLFNIDDTEPRATVVSMEETFQMAEKSNLKKFCDGALGRVLQPHEYERGFDISQFLGKAFMVTIINKAAKSDPNKIYNHIASVQGITDNIRRIYNIDWNLLVRSNDLQVFSIDPEYKCFQSENFAKLPRFLRDKIKNSLEGQEFAKRGGVFNETYQDNTTSTPVNRAPLGQPTGQPLQRQVQQPTSAPAPVAPVQPKGLIWLNKEFTYEQMKGAGWTDEQLVQNGYAQYPPKPAPAPAAPPKPQAPPVPQVPQVPAPQESFDSDEDEFIFGSGEVEDLPY